ncbi:MAG: hypothetical protein HRT68_12775 [Flavobacteriaceae bacterium]|nr:hypothetical protein [Flavobacteriaceae bacterium]
MHTIKPKTLFLIALLFSLFNMSFSQDISFEKGELIKDRLFLIDKQESTVLDKQGNIYGVRPHRVNGVMRNYYVEFFEDLNFGKRIEIETNQKTNVVTEIEETFALDNRLLVFTKEYTGSYATLYVDILGIDSKTFLERKELVTGERNSNKNVYKALKESNFEIKNNLNGFLLLLQAEEEDKLQVKLTVYGKNIEKVATKEFYPNKPIDFKKTTYLTVLADGDIIYILTSYEKEEKLFYRLNLLDENANIKSLDIPSKEGYYELVSLTNTDEELIIAGFVSKLKKGRYQGYCYYAVNKETFELSRNKYDTFKNQDISDYFSGFLKGDRGVQIKDVFVDEENNTYVACQFYKAGNTKLLVLAQFDLLIATAIYVSSHGNRVFDKLFDDILVVKFDAEGALVWENLIRLKTQKKKQDKNKQDYNYFSYYNEQGVNVLLNAQINNKEGEFKVNQAKQKSKTNLYNLVFSSSGQIELKAVLSNAKTEAIFPTKDVQIDQNHIYILGQGNMRKQMLKIQY